MSKSPKKESTEIFSIQFDQMNDSSEIPGIAELLGSKTTIKTKQNTPEPTSLIAVKFNRNAKTIQSLKEFGTQLEIHFLLKENAYQYIQHSALSTNRFMGLDELLHNMKISTAFTQEFGTFGEFQSSEKAYLFDAFGISEPSHLQFVLNQGNQILTVYVSEKSMLANKDEIIAYTENKNKNLSTSGIELDLSA